MNLSMNIFEPWYMLKSLAIRYNLKPQRENIPQVTLPWRISKNRSRLPLRWLKKLWGDRHIPYWDLLSFSTWPALKRNVYVGIDSRSLDKSGSVVSIDFKSRIAVKININLIAAVVHDTTVANHVSNTSMPFFCISPLTQTCAFNFLTSPEWNRLILKAHVYGTTFMSYSFFTCCSHAPIFCSVMISFHIASQKPPLLSPLVAWNRFKLSSALALVAKTKGWLVKLG